MTREEESQVLEEPRKTPFSKAIEINPRLTAAYYDRAIAYYSKGEYEKVWEDVYKAQSLGYQVPKKFLKALRKASGRER